MGIKYSYLPFRATIGDRDKIHIHHVTKSTGDLFVTTENATSLPWRTTQLDHEGGYNRIILNGPINGRATDKETSLGKNDPTCINKYYIGEGMGMHIRTLGSLYQSSDEFYKCFGVGGFVDVEFPPCEPLDEECYIHNSYFTMLRGSGEGKLEEFFDRDIHKVIYGDSMTYVKGNKSLLAKNNLFIGSYDVDVLVRNSIKCEDALEETDEELVDVTGVGELEADHSIHGYAQSYNNLFSELGTFVGSNGFVLIRSSLGISFIQGNIFTDGLAFASDFRIAPIPVIPVPKVHAPLIPDVAIQPGYYLFPDSHKAIIEDVWDENKQDIEEYSDNFFSEDIVFLMSKLR